MCQGPGLGWATVLPSAPNWCPCLQPGSQRTWCISGTRYCSYVLITVIISNTTTEKSQSQPDASQGSLSYFLMMVLERLLGNMILGERAWSEGFWVPVLTLSS